MLGKDDQMVTEAKVETSKEIKTLITLIKGMQVCNQMIHLHLIVLVAM